MPDKKSATKAAAKPAAKAAPAAKKAASAPRREPAAKKAAPAKPVKAAKAPPAKPAPKAETKAKAPAKPAPASKAAPKAVAKKPEAKPAAKAAKPEPKAAPKADPKSKVKAAPEPKAAKPAAKAKPEPKAKAEPAPKPEKVKAEKPAKAPKPPKPPKLAPVAAAFAGPIPSKPLAVAAGRAQPVLRTPIATPTRAAPKPLAAPKPVATEPEQVGDLKDVPAFKAKAPDKKGMILIGAIAGAFGVKGEIRLRAFTDKKEGVISYGPLYGEDGKILLKPKSWRELKDGVAVIAAEVKSREQAEKMKGQKLFVPRANLPATGADEYYVVDLLGSRAEALDGTVLGDIVAVWNFGAGDILEYKPPNGGPNVRVTFTKESVPHVDLPAKRVVLDPPPPEPPQSK